MKMLKYVFIITILIFINSFASEKGKKLFEKYSCNSCHSINSRLVGPSLKEIAERYGSSDKAIKKVAKLIIKPNPANWPGFAYMPPFNIPIEEAEEIAKYILRVAPTEKGKNIPVYDLDSDHF